MMHLFWLADLELLQHLYALRTAALTSTFLAITELGRDVVVIGIAFAISIALILYKRYADIAGLFVSIAGTGASVLILKYLIHRPRPDALYQAFPEGPFYSFPSAHAALSVALYGFCMYLLLQDASTRIRQFLIACMPAIMLLVGFSRLYLGVHYLSDVLTGFAIGALFVWFGVMVRLRLLRR